MFAQRKTFKYKTKQAGNRYIHIYIYKLKF